MNATPMLKAACWVTRNFHVFPGRWRLIHWINSNDLALRACQPTTVRIASGYHMFVQPGDGQMQRVYRCGLNPRDTLGKLFTAVLKPGDTALDVGANCGYYTVLASRLVGPQGRVHAWEASPWNFNYLQRNVEINPCQNVSAHWEAVSDRCGEVEFHEAPAGLSGLASMRDLGPTSGHTVHVPATTLDRRLGELPRVKLVKIDVEGADYLVLKGMRGLLERDRPYLICEFHDEWFREFGADGDEVFRFLQAYGYRMQRIEPACLSDLSQAPHDQCNIFCFPAGQPAPISNRLPEFAAA
ncbi:MAG: FkbM family methyltransferase [Planctomycetota bacterium]